MVNRYDVLVVPEDLDRRIAPRAGEAFLRHLATARVAVPHAESIAEEWVEVYCQAGPSAHEPFATGAWTSPEPVFLEAVVRFGTKAVDMPYGAEDQSINFFVEFRGCLFEDPTGPFRKSFKDILYVRPAVYARSHRKLPKHRKVKKSELPRDPVKKGRSGGMAGTRTEEW